MFSFRALSTITFAENRRANRMIHDLAEEAYKNDIDCPWHKFAKAGFPFYELSDARANEIIEYALIKFLSGCWNEKTQKAETA